MEYFSPRTAAVRKKKLWARLCFAMPREDAVGARDRLVNFGTPGPPPPGVHKKMVLTQHTAVRQERHEEHKTAAARGPFTPHQQDPHLAGELFA